VKYGREALNWNKFFHLLVWILAAPATIPIILGIYSNNDIPMFIPSSDLHVSLVATDTKNGSDIAVQPSIITSKFVEELHNITVMLQMLTFGALLLWLANILSSILIKIAIIKFFKEHYLDDTKLQKEFGIDTSLATVSQLLILAQIPGLVFACWFYFGTHHQWQNPIIIQSSFTLGASIQGVLNTIYYVSIRDVRLRFWVLIKKVPSTHAASKEENRKLISLIQ